MDEDISGFLGSVTPYGEADLSTFTLLHASKEGFCALYRGERAGQFRVFKCLKSQWRGQDLQEAILKKEFELGYPLRHPGICETYQYTFIEPLGNCIEMEWVDGVTLSTFLKHNRLDDKQFRKLAGELCDALSYLHSHQTVHRDIKPSNIMVTHDGHCIKLIDFGLADSRRSALLKTAAGTKNYIAPEVLRGQAADVRSDIWSLGAVLREMSPRRHRRAIGKCLETSPAKRYRSVQEVREALMRPNPWPAVAAVACIAALIAAALMLFKPNQPESESAPAPEPQIVQIDSLPRTDEGGTQKKETVKKSTPAPKESKSEQLDRIFQQATDLFEDALQ